MPARSAIVEQFAVDGALVIGGRLDAIGFAQLEGAFLTIQAGRAASRQFSLPASLVNELQTNTVLNGLAAELAEEDVKLVRIIAFDKTPEANWFVPWHQDRAIAVRTKASVSGYGNWTFKDGHHHVEPPVELLEGMVTLRIHFDDCTEESGPVEVIKGSHKLGRLDRERISSLVAEDAGHVCLARCKDILAMRPLTVHRSTRANRPGHRRVLHLEYCTKSLPPVLEWAL